MDGISLKDLFTRYVGKCVCVQCHGFRRYIGKLVVSTHDFIILRNVIVIDDSEGGRWQDETAQWSVMEDDQVGFGESVILMGHVTAITTDDNRDLVPIEEWQPEDLTPKAEPTPPCQILSKGARIQITVGIALIRLANQELIEKISLLRTELKSELGFEFPNLQLNSDQSLPTNGYRIAINGTTVGSSELWLERRVVINESLPDDVPGIPFVEPAFGAAAQWISTEDSDRVAALGKSVFLPQCVLISHLEQLILKHRREIFSYDITCDLLERLSKSSPALNTHFYYEYSQRLRLHEVLLGLIEEGVALNGLEQVAEAVAASQLSAVDEIVERIRPQIINSILRPAVDDSGRVFAVECSNEIVAEFPQILQSRELCSRLAKSLDQFADKHCSKTLRLALSVPSRFRRDLAIELSTRESRVVVISKDEFRHTRLRLNWFHFGEEEFCDQPTKARSSLPQETFTK